MSGVVFLSLFDLRIDAPIIGGRSMKGVSIMSCRLFKDLFRRFFSRSSTHVPTTHPEPQTSLDPPLPVGSISPPGFPPGVEMGPISRKWTPTYRKGERCCWRRFRIAGVDGEMAMYRDRVTWYGDDNINGFDCPRHLGFKGFWSVIREMRDEIRKGE